LNAALEALRHPKSSFSLASTVSYKFW